MPPSVFSAFPAEVLLELTLSGLSRGPTIQRYTRAYFELLCLLSPTGLGELAGWVLQDADTDVTTCEVFITT